MNTQPANLQMVKPCLQHLYMINSHAPWLCGVLITMHYLQNLGALDYNMIQHHLQGRRGPHGHSRDSLSSVSCLLPTAAPVCSRALTKPALQCRRWPIQHEARQHPQPEWRGRGTPTEAAAEIRTTEELTSPTMSMRLLGERTVPSKHQASASTSSVTTRRRRS